MAIILKCRQHPGHLLCERTRADIPVEGPAGIDEDDPVNSDYSMKLTKFSFQVDRYRNRLSGFILSFPFLSCLLHTFSLKIFTEVDTFFFKYSLFLV